MDTTFDMLLDLDIKYFCRNDPMFTMNIDPIPILKNEPEDYIQYFEGMFPEVQWGLYIPRTYTKVSGLSDIVEKIIRVVNGVSKISTICGYTYQGKFINTIEKVMHFKSFVLYHRLNESPHVPNIGCYTLDKGTMGRITGNVRTKTKSYAIRKKVKRKPYITSRNIKNKSFLIESLLGWND
jgi:hypothetical protein